MSLTQSLAQIQAGSSSTQQEATVVLKPEVSALASGWATLTVWLPIIAPLLAVYSIAVARKSLRLNRRTFEENRRRATYNLLMTQPALREIPLVAVELEGYLRERHTFMSASADKMSANEFRNLCKEANQATKDRIAPLQRRLLIAANAWGDTLHTSEVRNALEEWIDGVCTQIDEWTKEGRDIEESISVHDRGQAKLLSCIVAKDCSDQAPDSPSWLSKKLGLSARAK